MKKHVGLFLAPVHILFFFSSCSKDSKPTDADKDKTIPAISNIVYTEVRPDSVIISPERSLYNLDLNNDGITDFIFTEMGQPVAYSLLCRNRATGTEYGAFATPASGSNNAIENTNYLARVSDSSSLIDGDVFMNADTLRKVLYVVITGPPAVCNTGEGAWRIGGDRYLGLKLTKEGNTYYGWARLSKSNDQLSTILKGYAYDSIPNQQIRAGQIR